MSNPSTDYLDLSRGKITAFVAYSERAIEVLRRLAKKHAVVKAFDPKLKCWKFPLTAGADLVKHFPEAAVTDKLKAVLGAEQESEERGNAIAEAAIEHLGNPFEGGSLFAHQATGVIELARKRRVILADEMGLGKTRQAIIAARALQAASGAIITIICPANLKTNWKNELQAMGGTERVEIFSWAKLPEPDGKERILIADEAHFAQSMDSQRTGKFLAIAAGALAVFPLTGTPMPNGRPCNIFPLLKAIRHPLSRDRREFERRFCAAEIREMKLRVKRKGQPPEQIIRRFWDATGASNLPELYEQLAPAMLRRTKEECLDLPPKTRILRDVEVEDEARAEFTRTMKARLEDFDRRVASGQVNEQSAALAENTFMRQSASALKVGPAIELARELIDQGAAPILFTAFIETAEAIADGLKVKAYKGAITAEAKDRIVREFQDGSSPAFVSTYAGGTGLTLTRSNYVILVDRPYRPGDAEQAEDRAHRIGQRWPVTVIWLRALGICRAVDAILSSKQAAIGQAINGDAAPEIAATDLLNLVRQDLD